MKKLFSRKHDATSSWYGYEYQGKIAILYCLKKINRLHTENKDLKVPLVKINDYCLELEWLEDFSIVKLDKNKIVYEEIYQVKARENISKTDYENIFMELIIKYFEYGKVKTFMVSTNKINHTVELDDIKIKIREVLNEKHTIAQKSKSFSKEKFIENVKLLKRKEELDDKNFEKIRQSIRSLIEEKIKKVNVGIDDIRKAIQKDYILINDIICEITIHIDNLICYVDKLDKIENFYEEQVIGENDIDEEVMKEVRRYFKNNLEEEYKLKHQYIEKVKNALYTALRDRLEDKIANSKEFFRVSFAEIVEVLNAEKEIINQLHLLYFLKGRFNKYKGEYCDANRNLNICDEQKCKQCNLLKISDVIKKLSYEDLKKFLFNSNLLVNSQINLGGNYENLLQQSILKNYVFEELVRVNRYKYKKDINNISIKDDNVEKLFSFIDDENKLKLQLKLDKNLEKVIELMDFKFIINKNLNYKYRPQKENIKNQYNKKSNGRKEKFIDIIDIDFIGKNNIQG